jgi:DNA-directed RNA polymerase subunit RPC12/RpoP
MSDEELAKISTYCTTKPDYDCFEIEEWHSVFTADLYDSEEDAINYTIDWLKQAERKHSMIQQEARKNAFIAIEQDPSAVEYRSCWNCNGSHEHLKKHELIKCFECGRLYYKGIDISDDEQEDKP